jgi:hypothetical protein
MLVFSLVLLTVIFFIAYDIIHQRKEKRERENARDIKFCEPLLTMCDGGKPIDEEEKEDSEEA